MFTLFDNYLPIWLEDYVWEKAAYNRYVEVIRLNVVFTLYLVLYMFQFVFVRILLHNAHVFAHVNAHVEIILPSMAVLDIN